MNATPKRHILVPNDVFLVVVRQNLFGIVIGKRVDETRIGTARRGESNQTYILETVNPTLP